APTARRWAQQDVLAERLREVGADLVVGLAGGDASVDLRADRLRRLRVGLRNRLAAAHRTLDGVGQVGRALLWRGGRLVARADDERADEHDGHEAVAHLQLHGVLEDVDAPELPNSSS